VRVRILGCGTSTGVPKIGNDWGRCDPAEPRNARLRTSILVESASERMLVETDSPFLAPVPHRGQKCEPAFVADTARFVAGLRHEDPEQFAETTTANFFRLFGKAQAA
jgi:TatD DNase family protein